MSLTEDGLVATEGLLSRFVRLPGGVTAHYVTSGESGPAVVLLHGGLPGSFGAAGWTAAAVHLGKQGFRVYCPDQPSFGHTEDPLGHYAPGPTGHVDFLHDFTTALCLDRFGLAGNSMGSFNSLNYLLAHPERVERFALVAGPIGDIVPEQESKDLLDAIGWARPPMSEFDGTPESMRRLLGAITYDESRLDDDVIAMRTLSANRTVDAHRRHMAATFQPGTEPPAEARKARLRTAGRLDHVDIPGICLFGLDDTLLPVELGHLQEDKLPNVQFFYPSACGHQGQTDRPDLFNDVLTEFFRDGLVSAATAVRAGVSTRRPPLEGVVEPAPASAASDVTGGRQDR